MSTIQILFGAILVSGFLLISFFFVTTHGSLIFFRVFPSRVPSGSRHVYWIYRNRFLVWLTDRKFIVSAVLLFQYDRLVTALLHHFDRFTFRNGEIVQLGAVSGDLSQRLAVRCRHSARLSILEMTCTGIRHTMGKLDRVRIYQAQFIRGDARSIPMKDEAVDCTVSFFLFHELPTQYKREVLLESLRVVRPGGRSLFVEFHKPDSLLLRLLGNTIFGLFEPYAKEMWYWDPLDELDQQHVTTTRTLHFGGYFQVVCIEKH